MNEDTIIRFHEFSFQYNAQQNPTLKDINLTIHRGEKILIAGPSGCGKSTLVHCINGLIPFSYKGKMTGSLTINGRETKDMSLFDISATVGTVLQDSDGQFVGLTVAEDIAFALENDAVNSRELHERVLAAAKKVHIDKHLMHAPSELSGGQKQRVSLAGVMVDEVEVLLFDEPLANLDPATGKQTVELIDAIQKNTGATVLIVEHRLEDVLWRSVDRVILMEEGRILADTVPDELLAGNLLEKSGVREPLYITALKYAGVKITPEMHPWSIREIRLSDAQKETVRKWFASAQPEKEAEEKKTILECEDITFSYEKCCEALKGVSLTVKEGERIAIIGTNGAGKSTFSKVICGFETQQKGVIRLRGEDISALSVKERADHIGYVMQNPNQMISKVMIRDEVALGLKNRGVSEEEITLRTDEALKICGLWPFRNWPVSALSYGQKKRVTIASILALKPEIIILDEPTAGQDYRHYTEIMEFLLELNRIGITILMVTHDMHLMLEYARRAVAFDEGRIIADDKCTEVLAREDIIKRASLKETSLYDLARMCGIASGCDFAARFIACEREARRK